MVNENKVRQQVAVAVRKADLNTVSAKQIRRAVEKELGLNQDDLAEGKWRAIVNDVIEETLAAIDEGDAPNKAEATLENREEDITARTLYIDVTNVPSKCADQEGCDSGYSKILATEDGHTKAITASFLSRHKAGRRKSQSPKPTILTT